MRHALYKCIRSERAVKEDNMSETKLNNQISELVILIRRLTMERALPLLVWRVLRLKVTQGDKEDLIQLKMIFRKVLNSYRINILEKIEVRLMK